MSDYSDYLENELLDHWLGGADYTRAATVYVALFTAAPSDSGGGTEVSGNAYARAAVTNNATEWPAASGGSKSNANAITFTSPSGGGWGNVTHFALFDAASGGNMLAHSALDSAKTINDGDTVEFAASALTVTLD